MIDLIHYDDEDQQTFVTERGPVNRILDYSVHGETANLIAVYTLCCKAINLGHSVCAETLADDLHWTGDSVQYCLDRLKQLNLIKE